MPKYETGRDPYDAVLFDMDGVLLTTGHGAWFPRLENAVAGTLQYHDIRRDDPDHDTLYEALLDRDFHAIEAVRERRGHGERWARDLVATRQAFAAKEQRHQFRTGDRGVHADIGVIEDLSRDYAVGIVTNNIRTVADYLLDDPELAAGTAQDTLRPAVDTVVGVPPHWPDHIDGYRTKPDPTYLETAMAELDAEHALYVGDKGKDIAAARAADAAIDTVLVPPQRDGAAAHAARVDELPDYTAESLNDLQALLNYSI